MRSTISNLWARRHLLWVLTSSNIKRQNKNSMLGYLWWLLDPILMTGVYYFLVAILFKRGDPKAPYLLFLLIGLLCWKTFADSVSQSTLMLRSQASIIKAISFPKAILPLSVVVSNTFYFVTALIVAVGLACVYGPHWGTWPNLYYAMLPVIIGAQVLFSVGLALLVSVLGVFFADTANIIGHLLRMWFFLSPGLYSLDRVPQHLVPYFKLNPFSSIMTSYRDILIFGRMPSLGNMAYAIGAGIVSCALGMWVFKRLEGRLVQKL